MKNDKGMANMLSTINVMYRKLTLFVDFNLSIES